MRFQHKVGDKKYKKKFLFLPQGPSGDVRWLEFATVEYEWVRSVFTDGPMERWKPVRFVK